MTDFLPMHDGVFDYDNFSYNRRDVTPPLKKEMKFDSYIFKITEWYISGEYLVVKINYPTAKHYEGNKVLVYEGLAIEELKKRTSIDPHFSESKDFPSPIARFEPTNEGWLNAMKFASMLHSERLELSY
jgi:hypothetical protein